MESPADRLHFIERRKRGIGGSDLAPILGVSKFRNGWDVLAAKRGLKPRTPEEMEADHLLIGRLMEPVVAELYTRKEGRALIVPPAFIQHPEHDCIIANPDRFVASLPRGVEIKTCGLWGRSEWGEEHTDQVPADFLMQAVHYMSVTGWSTWDIPVLFHGSRYARYTILRDLDLERWAMDRAVAWWRNHVVDGWDLPIDGSKACSVFMGLRYPRNDRPLEQASKDAAEAAERLAHLRRQMDATLEEATELENRLKDEIGESDGIMGSFGRLTWKKIKDGEVTDWKAIAETLMGDMPKEQLAQLIAEHTTTKPGYRRFVLTTKAEKKDD